VRLVKLITKGSVSASFTKIFRIGKPWRGGSSGEYSPVSTGLSTGWGKKVLARIINLRAEKRIKND